jgi:hypothetical protein
MNIVWNITLYDAAGRTLHSEPMKRMKRFSMEAAANQKRLDVLAREHVNAVTAAIGNANFVIRNGKSACVL